MDPSHGLPHWLRQGLNALGLTAHCARGLPMRRFPVFRRFDVNAASAVLLVLAAVTALVMANSPWAAQYVAVVQYKLRLGFGAWSELGRF